MRRMPLATSLALSVAALAPHYTEAADLLIPFAVNVDIEPQAEYVASFIDTSACDRFAVFLSGDTRPGSLILILRPGVPDGGSIVRTGSTGALVNGDETGGMVVWESLNELIAPRMQPVLMNNGPGSIHVNKAWVYCKTQGSKR